MSACLVCVYAKFLVFFTFNYMCAEINLDKIKTKPIFKWLKNKGVSDKEMLKTFNCGIGFCIITKQKNVRKILEHLE